MFAAGRRVALVLLSTVCFAGAALADGVETLGIFPSDRFMVLDSSQNTLRRVNLPVPADCPGALPPTPRWLQCQDIAVLNTLDGFNIQPRISIEFDGPIDVSTVNSESVFLVSLGLRSFGERVGINQVVWDPPSNTLHVESKELLEQHTPYAVVVTNRVRDASGKPLKKARPSQVDDDERVERATRRRGGQVVAATIFTTQSVTSTLEKVRTQIQASIPGPANFNLGASGERTVFPLATLGSVLFNRDRPTPPLPPRPDFSATVPVPTPALFAIPGAVGAVAFGSYVSPNYQVSPGEFIPPQGTRTGIPVARENTVYFNLVLPATPKPAEGWPVAIFGHGFGDNKNNSPFVVAASMAAQGIATIAINVVGHGFGPDGTITVSRTGGLPDVTLSAGGRGVDQNGSGTFDSTEGSSAGAPRILIGSSDALRQTTIDLMQLVRQIQAGMDVDGNGSPDLDSNRIYYFGQSFGGIYGTIFLGVERDVRAGVPNVPGGAIIDIVRLSPTFRGLFVLAAQARNLFNLPGAPFVNENLPLRDQPAVVNHVPGAMALQEYTERAEWASQVGNPVAYAPYIRKSPLSGNAPKPVIYQIAKGDQTVPNPTSTAIIRAGDLQDRVTYYRNDTAFAATGGGVPRNPHAFLTNIALDPPNPVAAAIAFKAQYQIARFFATGGALTIDPDLAPPPLPGGLPPLFETPIMPPLPEGLNFLP
jgi:hypothetical protein